MGSKNTNWEPEIKEAMSNKKKKFDVGIDANSDERYKDLAANLKKKRGFRRAIIIIIILLVLFDVLFMNGEFFINILKNLTK